MTDTASTFGEMFLLYYTGPSITTFLDAAAAEEEKRLAEERRLKEEEEARLAAEEGRKNAVYVDEPMKSRVYVSETMDKTAEEIKALEIVRERPLYSLAISRPVQMCGRKLQRFDYNHDRQGLKSFEKTKYPEFDMHRRERDIAVQAAPETKDGDSQTKWNRPVNMTTQYESVSSGTSECNIAVEYSKLVSLRLPSQGALLAPFAAPCASRSLCRFAPHALSHLLWLVSM